MSARARLRGAAAASVVAAMIACSRSPSPATRDAGSEPASSVSAPSTEHGRATVAPSASAAPARGGAPTTPEEYLARVTPMLCDWAIRCGPIPESARADCALGPGRSKVSPELWDYWGNRHVGEVDAEAALGRYRFDGAHAAACLDALARERCHGVQVVPERCDPILRAHWAPAVAIGGACKRHDACIDGFCDEGHCAPYRAPGQPCRDRFACGPPGSGWCELETPESGRCAHRLGADEACQESRLPCAEPLVCNPSRPGAATCGPPPGEGESCGSREQSRFCQPGLFCDINEPKPRCRKPLPVGAACRTEDACDERLDCEGLVLGAPTLVYAGASVVRAPGHCRPRAR
jgi:hypothetical protein